MLSVRIMFDKIVFPPDYIRSYEFNIANRTFKYIKDDYKPNFELPAVIVTLNEDHYSFGERPTIAQHMALENINQIEVLYDRKSDVSVYIQEEHIRATISIMINCESQFQAKEVEFSLKRNLPMNKHISLFDFTSFLEISPKYMASLGIDYNGGETSNLYTRMNHNTGDIEYCYSINYKPLIRLESIVSSIADTSQRSYAVNAEIMYQIQMPMWLGTQVRSKGIIEKISIDFSRFGHESISENSMRQINNPIYNDKYGDIIYFTKRNLIISDLTDYELTKIDPETDDSAYLLSIQFAKDDFIISKRFRFNIFDVEGTLNKNVIPVEVDELTNTVIFNISQDQYIHYYRATLTTPIIIQFVEERTAIVEDQERKVGHWSHFQSMVTTDLD